MSRLTTVAGAVGIVLICLYGFATWFQLGDFMEAYFERVQNGTLVLVEGPPTSARRSAAKIQNIPHGGRMTKGGEPPHTSGAIPKIIHTVWMANSLKPYFFASLDSVLRFMPDVTFKLHILTPSGANATVLSAIYSQFEAQLKPFLDVPGFDLRIVLHDDVPSELIGTPVENIGITQEHMGGTVERLLKRIKKRGDRQGSPHGDNISAMVHACDFYRLLCLYREGGLYMDTDHIMLRNMWPLLDAMGSFVLCETQSDAREDGNCKLLNGFFAASPRHEFLLDGLHRIQGMIVQRGVNALFPLRERLPGEHPLAAWTVVGPNLFSVIKRKWLDEKDVWVVSSSASDCPTNSTVEHLRHRAIREPAVHPPNVTSIATSLSVVGRRFFIPTYWQEATLHRPLDENSAEKYSRAYSFHLWEMGLTSKNLIRPNFISIVRDKPESVLAHLFKRTCLIICDPELLSRPFPLFRDLIGDAVSDPSREVVSSGSPAQRPLRTAKLLTGDNASYPLRVVASGSPPQRVASDPLRGVSSGSAAQRPFRKAKLPELPHVNGM